MFGDMGHGTLLFAFGLYLMLFKDSIMKGGLKVMLPYRYIIALMGFFAAYCGLIYNDFLSLSFDFFGSCYNPNNSTAFDCLTHGAITNTTVDSCYHVKVKDENGTETDGFY
mmetsp:Transcript_11773/g.16550  ORF Transcript_11773/g.16550 Transcript_11773/m.16550 type:complete len:111 (-) Transcript_11773:1123-1455(-)